MNTWVKTNQVTKFYQNQHSVLFTALRFIETEIREVTRDVASR